MTLEKNVEIGKALGQAALETGNQLNKALGAQQYAAARESAQTIARSQLKSHEKEAAAWRWLDAAMGIHKPSEEEEAALFDLLIRARRERY